MLCSFIDTYWSVRSPAGAKPPPWYLAPPPSPDPKTLLTPPSPPSEPHLWDPSNTPPPPRTTLIYCPVLRKPAPIHCVTYYRWGFVYGQNGVDLSFCPCLPASIWGHCSKVLVFISIRGTQKGGVTMTLFVLFFPASGYLGTGETLQHKGQRNVTNRPCFTPPQGGVAPLGFRTLQMYVFASQRVSPYRHLLCFFQGANLLKVFTEDYWRTRFFSLQAVVNNVSRHWKCRRDKTVSLANRTLG